MSGTAGRRAASAVGQLLVTAGLVVLLFCVYALQVTGVRTARAQSTLDARLDRAWAVAPLPTAGTGPPRPGDAVARLHLPTLRRDPLVVVEGVRAADLQQGPGHLPGSALPGEVGNLVLSGHRTTHGGPFADLDRLAPGDALVVESRAGWATYRVTGRQVVAPTAVEVTLPVPGAPGAAPTQALVTLTTCHPRWSARQRLVVQGVLEEAVARGAGRPAALGG